MSQDWRARSDGEQRADAPHFYWGDTPRHEPWVPSEPPRRAWAVSNPPRSSARKWVFIVLGVALGLLLLKPLLVLAAILIGAVVGLLVLGILAVGALLLVGRVAFGWRWPSRRAWAAFGGPAFWIAGMRRGANSPHRYD